MHPLQPIDLSVFAHGEVTLHLILFHSLAFVFAFNNSTHRVLIFLCVIILYMHPIQPLGTTGFDGGRVTLVFILLDYPHISYFFILHYKDYFPFLGFLHFPFRLRIPLTCRLSNSSLISSGVNR